MLQSRPTSLVLTAGLVFALLAGGCTDARTQPSDPLAEPIRPERTEFRETSSYREVVDYLTRAASARDDLHLTTFGYTIEGRALPLLVAGPVEDASPEGVRASGLPVIYLQGNIHAGEVAGKEALLRTVRRLASGELDRWLSDLVLLVGPIYNADGNELLDLENRPRQHGPVGGMGTRANARGLNLNRDQMKLDSPEARSLARLLTEYDPHVFVDLHTTNGTRHAYHLTYAPPLHPATPAEIDGILREDLLPSVDRRIEERWGWHFWHYGNVGTRGGVRGWYTFDHRPRFVTNYAGLRNRLGILSEAYSYATFEDRILASERFVEEIVEWVRANADRVRAVTAAEDERDLRGESLPVRARMPGPREVVTILMGEVVEERHPFTGRLMLRRTDTIVPEEMPAVTGFEGTDFERVPHAYLVPRELEPVLDLLEAHGVGFGPLPGEAAEIRQRFAVEELDRAENPLEGRREVHLEGTWGEVPTVLSQDALEEYVAVPMNQPLARLVFLLLEPRADDGLANWGILDPWLEAGADYPILRTVDPAHEPLAAEGGNMP